MTNEITSVPFPEITSEKKVVDHALLDRRSIRIRSKSDKPELARKDNTRLRNLYRNIVQIEREIGLQETYLGFPFLVGNVNDEFYVRGPLILFPINLEFKHEGKQPGWYIVFPEDRKPILNRALIEPIKKKGCPSLTDSFSSGSYRIIYYSFVSKYTTNTAKAQSISSYYLQINRLWLDWPSGK